MAPSLARGASKAKSPPSGPSRGGIRKRTPQPRVEKDGDLVMAGAADSKQAPGARRGAHANRGSSRPINTQSVAKAIGRTNPKDINIKDASKLREASHHHKFTSYDQICVRGWKQSEAAKNTDQGIPQLISFIDRKASRTDNLKIVQESQVRGDNLFIYTKAEDRERVLKLNHYQFARASLSIELKREAEVSARDVKAAIKAMILRRYNEEQKFLDFSALGSDPELKDMGMFETDERALKVFTVIITVCESIWTSNFKRAEAIKSISLAKNNLVSVRNVSILSVAFPKILNLDLSDNALANLKAIEPWSRKFRLLDHLVLRGNAIEDVPDFHLEILKWFPKLTKLDTVEIRTQDQVAKTVVKIPVAPPIQQGDKDIADSFVAQYFAAFDSNRSAAVTTFYSEDSVFSINVKTRSTSNYKTEPWGKWLSMSRNLQKITTAHGQDNRLFAGLSAIDKAFSDMPPTKHPDIVQEKDKWLMECQSIEGLADPTGQSPTGVNGLLITMHGEITEIATNGQTTATRSFDRVFILGPGEVPGSIKVMKDMLTLRPYTGNDRFKPTMSPQMPAQQVDNVVPTITLNNGIAAVKPPINATLGIPPELVVPDDFTLPTPNKSQEQLQKEVLALELAKATRLTIEYSGQCLAEAGWDPVKALQLFETNKAQLPSNIYW